MANHFGTSCIKEVMVYLELDKLLCGLERNRMNMLKKNVRSVVFLAIFGQVFFSHGVKTFEIQNVALVSIADFRHA